MKIEFLVESSGIKIAIEVPDSFMRSNPLFQEDGDSALAAEVVERMRMNVASLATATSGALRTGELAAEQLANIGNGLRFSCEQNIASLRQAANGR